MPNNTHVLHDTHAAFSFGDLDIDLNLVGIRPILKCYYLLHHLGNLLGWL